jgi:hypothetical protein
MNAQPATATLQKSLGAFYTVSKQVLQRLAEGADGNFEKVEIVDQFLLRGFLGLSQKDCVLLREAAAQIESWRKHK